MYLRDTNEKKKTSRMNKRSRRHERKIKLKKYPRPIFVDMLSNSPGHFVVFIFHKLFIYFFNNNH